MRELTEYNGFWFHPETCQKVKDIISNLPRNTRIRLFYGNTETGEVWTEENDVCGYIGRSTGSVKIPLLINNKNSFGGGSILDNRIVGIVTTSGNWLYKHGTLNVGLWDFYTTDDTNYHVTVTHNHKIYANLKTQKQAQNLIAFMQGRRFCK